MGNKNCLIKSKRILRYIYTADTEIDKKKETTNEKLMITYKQEEIAVDTIDAPEEKKNQEWWKINLLKQ